MVCRCGHRGYTRARLHSLSCLVYAAAQAAAGRPAPPLLTDPHGAGSKPAARMTGQTDGRTHDRFV